MAADTVWDLETPQTAVLLQHRDVVALNRWLHAALVDAHATERTLAVVTPPWSVLTLSAAQALRAYGARWVVDARDDLFDGSSGARLEWDGGRFTEAGSLHPGYLPSDDPWALHVAAEAVHPYDTAEVGALTSAVFRAAGLGPPEGYGVLEPVDAPYTVGGVGRLVDAYAPRPATITAVSAAGDALITARQVDSGTLESTEILAGAPTPLERDALTDFTRDVLTAGAQVARLGYRRAADGRYLSARRAGPTLPAALVVTRNRLPGLTDDELLALGPGIALIEVPVPALRVTWDVDPDHTLAGSQAVVQCRRLLAALTDAAGTLAPATVL